jgi:urease alpha subunit
VRGSWGDEPSPFVTRLLHRDQRTSRADADQAPEGDRARRGADGELLTCAPAEVLPMAQRYFLF